MKFAYLYHDKSNKLYVASEFEFEKGPLLYDPNLLNPYWNITFRLCPIINEEGLELIAEQLKQDFIKFATSVNPPNNI